MSLNSHLEWTDATWNPVRGCTKISPGCKHCYAETFAERFRGVEGHPSRSRVLMGWQQLQSNKYSMVAI
jgi:protein gp37